MKQFKSLIAYTHNVPLLKLKHPDTLQKVLHDYRITDPSGSEWSTTGFFGNSAGDMYYHNGAATLIYVAIRERILPGAVIQADVKRRAEKLATRQGRPCHRKEYAQLREDAEAMLLPKSHIREILIPVILRGDYMFICTSSARRADVVTGLLVKVLEIKDSDDLMRIETMRAPESWMTDLALAHGYTDEATDTFQPGSAITLVSKDTSKGTISFKDEDAGSDRVTTLIEKGGYSATKMRIETDKMAFTLNGSMALSSIKFHDISDDHAEYAEYDNDEDRVRGEFDSNLTVAALTFADIMDNLVESLGGIRVISDAGEDDDEDDDEDEDESDPVQQIAEHAQAAREGLEVDEQGDEGSDPDAPAQTSPERYLTFWHDETTDEYFYLRNTDEEPGDEGVIQVTREQFEMEGGDVLTEDDHWLEHGDPEPKTDDAEQQVIDEDDDEL